MMRRGLDDSRTGGHLADAETSDIRVSGDVSICRGYASCLIVAPTVFDLDEDARKVVLLDSSPDQSLAKWWTSTIQNDILDHCVQIHGGYGFMNEYRVARAWKDARVTKIWAGGFQRNHARSHRP